MTIKNIHDCFLRFFALHITLLFFVVQVKYHQNYFGIILRDIYL